MANEIISKGITLTVEIPGGEMLTLNNLYEIPELGGDAESIEVTNLSDEAHRYTDGILNYGDSLTFKFYYEKNQFTALQGAKGKVCAWSVALPDGTTCGFDGACSVKLDGVGVNAALTYSLNVKPSTAMLWA